jgi:hypothetical protein
MTGQLLLPLAEEFICIAILSEQRGVAPAIHAS